MKRRLLTTIGGSLLAVGLLAGPAHAGDRDRDNDRGQHGRVDRDHDRDRDHGGRHDHKRDRDQDRDHGRKHDRDHDRDHDNKGDDRDHGRKHDRDREHGRDHDKGDKDRGRKHDRDHGSAKCKPHKGHKPHKPVVVPTPPVVTTPPAPVVPPTPTTTPVKRPTYAGTATSVTRPAPKPERSRPDRPVGTATVQPNHGKELAHTGPSLFEAEVTLLLALFLAGGLLLLVRRQATSR